MQQGLKTYFVSQLHRVRKKGTDSILSVPFFRTRCTILAVTLTNLDSFS